MGYPVDNFVSFEKCRRDQRLAAFQCQAPARVCEEGELSVKLSSERLINEVPEMFYCTHKNTRRESGSFLFFLLSLDDINFHVSNYKDTKKRKDSSFFLFLFLIVDGNVMKAKAMSVICFQHTAVAASHRYEYIKTGGERMSQNDRGQLLFSSLKSPLL